MLAFGWLGYVIGSEIGKRAERKRITTILAEEIVLGEVTKTIVGKVREQFAFIGVGAEIKASVVVKRPGKIDVFLTASNIGS